MSESAVRSSPWVWEELDPGLSFAPQREVISDRDVELWRTVTRVAEEPVPARALLVPLMMRAFIEASAPRAPGNIHVSQELGFPGREPIPGEPLDFTFTISERRERKGRGWVNILVECRAAGDLLMNGTMVLIWAGRRALRAVQNA